jgi:hypothetical protein
MIAWEGTFNMKKGVKREKRGKRRKIAISILESEKKIYRLPTKKFFQCVCGKIKKFKKIFFEFFKIFLNL